MKGERPLTKSYKNAFKPISENRNVDMTNTTFAFRFKAYTLISLVSKQKKAVKYATEVLIDMTGVQH
jgi:hypothetical protein